MKKIISIMFCVCLITAVFSACGKQNGNRFQTGYLDGDYESSKLDNSSADSFSDTSSNTDVSSNISSTENSSSGKNETTSNNNSFQIEDLLQGTNQLPDYNLNAINLEVFSEESRYIKVVSKASIGDFNIYANKLINSGFTKYDENAINNCKFMTLINKQTFVSMSYMASEKKITVISEPLGDLYPRAADNKYKSKNMQSLFTGMKNQNDPIYSGMGFIIRLSDGRFIIIDGGGGDYNSVDSNNILNILREQSPVGTKKPVIAAWILTHAHNDHTGAFNAFTMDFHDKVIVESFYYNFPSDGVIANKTSGFSHNEYYSQPKFYECVKKYPGAKVIRPHTGEKIYISNAVIDVMFSYESFFPDSFQNGALNDFNNSSLVLKINIDNQSMLITADTTSPAMDIMKNIFGNYLQSDILQMAHHGQNGTVDFYSFVNPKYVLVPVSHVDENRVYKNAANKWLVNSSNVKQFISFWGQNVTIPLPYNPTSSQIYDRIPTANTKYYQYPLH
ncbi:MAG: MBL fold metallo-hydrolase [Clostridia bacterium]|nr:MBL fold metallo-hydrolase [Clostridia bacterium]